MTDTDNGVAIVVWRRAPQLEVLLLHRTLFGPAFEGEWAWTTPGGAREPGERPDRAARRELLEETALDLACISIDSDVAAAQPGVDVAVFGAEASPDDQVVLSDEHDRFEWVAVEEVDRCLPAWVAEMYREVLHRVPGA